MSLILVARLEFVQHGAELRATVGGHGGLLLVDDFNPPQAKTLGEAFALRRLLADGAFLLARIFTRALAHINDVPQGFGLLTVFLPVLTPKTRL